MKKFLKALCLLTALGLAFVLGWRWMPGAWPRIKEKVVYSVAPGLRPEPTPAVTPEPYTPHGDAAYAYGEEAAAGDSVIYYFYKDYCPYCRALEPLTAGLPRQITLPDGTKSDVKLICLNKVEDEALRIITDYYDANGIPEERRYVPAMVIGERYLFLDSEIVPGLLEALLQGEGLDTPLLDGAQRVP